MSLGFERLNEHTSRPNALINFIKPLPGPDQAKAEDFLERVAAVCYPVMKANYIAVMALEEYEPNPEFIGRNFNAGEVIQLVLKSRSGHWLPFRHVQMVMMHELAHCKQMNHSKFFWAVQRQYASELKVLWSKGYLGEGLWGRGQALLSGTWATQTAPTSSDLPENLCGGTYRRQRRKRKRKPGQSSDLSYAEKKQRRILKKFGASGIALGEDEEKRLHLESGKKNQGKPRVAGSARGRELRAAAALARFDKVKEEPTISDSDSETESENEYTALPVDSATARDAQGHGYIKVCEGEDENDENAWKELEELRAIDEEDAAQERRIKDASTNKANSAKSKASGTDSNASTRATKIKPASSTSSHAVAKAATNVARPSATSSKKKQTPTPKATGASKQTSLSMPKVTPQSPTATVDNIKGNDASSPSCAVCSLANAPGSLTCMACNNVLNTKVLKDHWRCKSLTCRNGEYINAGDCSICGLCGAAKALSVP